MHPVLKAAVAAVLVGLPAIVQADPPVFVSSVPDGTYVRGTLYTGSGAELTGYTDPTVCLGKPGSLVAGGGGYPPNVLNPFSAHYETTALAAFGQTGSLTLEFPSAVPILSGPMIGVYTNAGFNDGDWPNGQVAGTFAQVEYSAERTAVVEVADDLSNFKSLGRVKFDMPVNYYSNLTDPYASVAPASPVEADFAKPYTGSATDFDGKTLSQVLTQLDGSAGGTWITVPQSLGLSEIKYIRFSDPMWEAADRSLSETAYSSYYASPGPKYADLFVNGVSARVLPEPGTGATVLLISLGVCLRRRRRA